MAADYTNTRPIPILRILSSILISPPHQIRYPVRMSDSIRRQMLLAAASMAAALALVACGGGDEPSAPESSSGSVALGVPDLAISAYQGQDALGGEDTSLSTVVSQGKPVVLNFWAALCPPCRAEMPEFERVHEERGDEVTILGIDIGPQQFLGTREEGQELLTELGVTYPAGTTFDDTVVRGFEILGMPTTFFIGADGAVVRKWSGILDEEKLNELVDELVGGAAAAGLPSEETSAGQTDAPQQLGEEFI